MEQKDQKIRKYEDGSEQVIGALVEMRRPLGPALLESAYEARPSTPLAAAPSPFLIFPIFLSVLSCLAPPTSAHPRQRYR